MAAEDNEEGKNTVMMKVFVTVPRPRDHRCAPAALKVVALKVSIDDTVASVKAKLRDMEGIPPHRQRLVFASSALPDDDGTTLADHGVTESSTIQLVETKIDVFLRIFNRPGAPIISLSGVESSDTVESFRLRVQERVGIWLRPRQQRLVYGVHQMEDGHTLADYGVRGFAPMTLITRPVSMRHRVVELDIEVTDTVGRIKERVEEAEGVPVACQSVYYHGEELHDGGALVAAADGRALEWVNIECQPMAVETETIKRRGADVDVTSPGGNIRKREKTEQKPLAEIPAVQRRRFVVILIGPELDTICPSSCDTDPAG